MDDAVQRPCTLPRRDHRAGACTLTVPPKKTAAFGTLNCIARPPWSLVTRTTQPVNGACASMSLPSYN